MTRVDLEYELVRILRTLPDVAREQVLQFAKSLQPGPTPPKPATDPVPAADSLLGSFHRFGIGLTDEELAQARREMWTNFPRDITDPTSP